MAYRPKDTQERILHRLKIVQGHLTKVMKMVENQEYCIDILDQSQAVQRALKEIDVVVMEHHLKHCVADAIQNGKQDEAINEILSVLRKAP